VRSLIAAPLLDSSGSHGMIVLSSRIHVRRFAEQDLELLTALGSVAALRIRNLSRPGPLENCLRVTIGTPTQNRTFWNALRKSIEGGA